MTFYFLVSLFRLKKSSFFGEALFFLGGGGSAQNVSAPYENPRPLACPLPHLKNRCYATAFSAPGKRLVMWVLKYFIYPINFAPLKMFHNLLLFCLFTSLSIIFTMHTILNLRKMKNEVTAKKNNDFFFLLFFSFLLKRLIQKTTQHTLSRTPPPPPPQLSRMGALLELPALNVPFRDNPGGGAYKSRKGAPVPVPLPLPSPTLWT